MEGKIILSCGHEDHVFKHGIHFGFKGEGCDYYGLHPQVVYGSHCVACTIQALQDYPDLLVFEEWQEDEYFEDWKLKHEGRKNV